MILMTDAAFKRQQIRVHVEMIIRNRCIRLRPLLDILPVKKYEQITGKKSGGKEVVTEQKVTTAFFPLGETRLELLKGTHPDSPISKFINKRGEGIHHICFEVENLAQSKTEMSKTGLQFIENISEAGAGGSKVAFM